MLLGLRTATFRVAPAQIAAVRDWYARALGIQPYFDQPFYVGFNVGGFELGMAAVEDARPAAGSLAVYWGVNDIEAAVRRLEECGAARREPITDVGEGIRVATVLDPFGNELGVIENPHFGKG
ncbi:MAG TPA: VOC family protein [Terriglobales bacterium]|jgi:predicted enzyme related to lactoylglutathione lyase